MTQRFQIFLVHMWKCSQDDIHHEDIDWSLVGERELSNGGSRNKRTASAGMKRTEAGLAMFSMFLKTGGRGAGGGGRAAGG